LIPEAHLLMTSLQVSVPIKVAELQRLPPEILTDMLRHRGPDLADIIASRSDILMFGGGKRGEVAHVFAAVTEALALGALVPGGIQLLGLRWQVVDSVLHCTAATVDDPYARRPGA
jgi:hypothetical protein